MATLSTGEHYLIDLVPGFAFGTFAALIGLKRYKPALAFLGVACCWSLAVRYEYSLLAANPMVVRGGTLLTLLALGVAAYCQRDTRQQPEPVAVAESEILVP